MKAGIRREDKNQWEARVPIVPADALALKQRHGLDILVQPSPIRAFKQNEFLDAGATFSEDLSACEAVFGVKEFPIDFFRKHGTYIFFSHTIKGQAHNMPLLQRLLDLQCNLIDYEKIEDENGRRLVFFGTFAGEAGMIDSLWALGRRLEHEGAKTPFAGIRQANTYKNLEDALECLQKIGKDLKKNGLPEGLAPLLVVFLGYGNVAKGAQRVFDVLPHEEISPECIPDLFQKKNPPRDRLFKAVFKEEHMVEPAEGQKFDLKDYFNRPARYRAIFEPTLPYPTVIMNCIFWSRGSPRFITRAAIEKLFQGRATPRLKVIGDVSCDIGGGVEITLKATDTGNPLFVFDVDQGVARDGVQGRGPVILAVDNLPCELPLDSSIFFSRVLSPFVPEICGADYGKPYESLALSPALKKALVVHRGRLTPPFRYLENHLKSM